MRYNLSKNVLKNFYNEFYVLKEFVYIMNSVFKTVPLIEDPFRLIVIIIFIYILPDLYFFSAYNFYINGKW